MNAYRAAAVLGEFAPEKIDLTEHHNLASFLVSAYGAQERFPGRAVEAR